MDDEVRGIVIGFSAGVAITLLVAYATTPKVVVTGERKVSPQEVEEVGV